VSDGIAIATARGLSGGSADPTAAAGAPDGERRRALTNTDGSKAAQRRDEADGETDGGAVWTT
jgi:hypothetical protein